jgi:hypothetical protein
VLEAYCSWLENRVVSRFDTATAEGNYPQQAQVVAIMTELDKEKSIAKVWTACSPDTGLSIGRDKAGMFTG